MFDLSGWTDKQLLNIGNEICSISRHQFVKNALTQKIDRKSFENEYPNLAEFNAQISKECEKRGI